jgi:hypothetical protein
MVNIAVGSLLESFRAVVTGVVQSTRIVGVSSGLGILGLERTYSSR